MTVHAYTHGFLRGHICPCLDWRCCGGDPECQTEYIERDPVTSLMVWYYRLRRWFATRRQAA